MNQFIHRIANYVANEIIIKGLANSKTFQRFAVRTDSHIQNLRNTSQETINSKLDEIHQAATRQAFSTSTKSQTSKQSSNIASRPTPPERGIIGFFRAFGKEIQKDLGLGNGK